MTKNDEVAQQNESKILKVDALGRVRVPEEKREELLDTFERSGMSGRQFAQQHGIHVQTFASWIQKRRRARGDYKNEQTRRKLRMRKGAPRHKKSPPSGSGQSLSLIEVQVEDPQKHSALELILPSGVAIKVTSSTQLDLLKTVLTALSC